LDYHSIVWLDVLRLALLGIYLGCGSAPAQDPPPKSEPHYDSTFSGPLLEVADDHIVVSRSILGKQPEKRTFLIKPDTRVEGKLRVKVKVTVGFVASEEGDVARLIVVRVEKKK
jgi:hypothetical protein